MDTGEPKHISDCLPEGLTKPKRAKALKPKVMYYPGGGDGLLWPCRVRNDTTYLCLPLTQASKRKMVEVMIKAADPFPPHQLDKAIEAALGALLAMAKEQS